MSLQHSFMSLKVLRANISRRKSMCFTTLSHHNHGVGCSHCPACYDADPIGWRDVVDMDFVVWLARVILVKLCVNVWPCQ